MKLKDLRPGDRYKLMHLETTFISCVTPHPLYPTMSLFTWVTVTGMLTLDALNPETEIDPADVKTGNNPAFLKSALHCVYQRK